MLVAFQVTETASHTLGLLGGSASRPRRAAEQCDEFAAFMINVYAAVAQEERRMISDRTKAGLAAAKARGVKLCDCPQSTKRARRTP